MFRVRHKAAGVRESGCSYGSVMFWVDALGLLCQPAGEPSREFADLCANGWLISSGPLKPITVSDEGAGWFQKAAFSFDLEPAEKPADALPAASFRPSPLVELVKELEAKRPEAAKALFNELLMLLGYANPAGGIPGEPIEWPGGVEPPNLPRLTPGESDPSTWALGYAEVPSALVEPAQPITEPEAPTIEPEPVSEPVEAQDEAAEPIAEPEAPAEVPEIDEAPEAPEPEASNEPEEPAEAPEANDDPKPRRQYRRRNQE